MNDKKDNFKQLNVRVPEELIKDLKIISINISKSVQEIVIEVLQDYVKKSQGGIFMLDIEFSDLIFNILALILFLFMPHILFIFCFYFKKAITED